MDDEEYDVIAAPLEVPEDTDMVGEFVAAGARYPLAVVPVRVPKGVYTIRLELGLQDREAVIVDVDDDAGTITLRHAYPDLPREEN